MSWCGCGRVAWAALVFAAGGAFCGEAGAAGAARRRFQGVEYSVHVVSSVPTSIYHLFQDPLKDAALATVVAENVSGSSKVLAASARLPGFSPLMLVPKKLVLPPGGTAAISLVPPISPEKYGSFSQPRAVTVVVEVSVDGRPAPALESRVLFSRYDFFPWALETSTSGLRSAGDAGGRCYFYLLLSSWVNQHFAEWEGILNAAASRSGGLLGYQPPQKPGWTPAKPGDSFDTMGQVKAIYEAVQERYRPVYVSNEEAWTPLSKYQVIRHPLQADLGRANLNCIDGVILFSSILLRAGFEPVIAAIPGHALLGWRLASGSESIEFLDTTVTNGFEAAVAEARRRILDEKAGAGLPQQVRESFADAKASALFRTGAAACGNIGKLYLTDVRRAQSEGYLPTPVVLNQSLPTRDEGEILEMLDRWQVAWEQRDLDGYVLNYSTPAFSAVVGGTTALARMTWPRFKEFKRERFLEAYKSISIERSVTRIFMTGEAGAKAYFYQRFTGVRRDGTLYTDSGYKHLGLVREGPAWKIASEAWSR